MKKIRVLILASSSSFAAITAHDLLIDRDIEVVASVFSDRDALRVLDEGNVDALLCDGRVIGLSVPVFAQRVLQQPNRAPLVLLCAANAPDIQADGKGIFSVVRLPLIDNAASHPRFVMELIAAIRATAKDSGQRALNSLRYKWRPGLPFASRFAGIIAIGASAGGTEATETLIRNLPSNMPGIVITQHMPPGFTKTYAERLDKMCSMTVREAMDGDEVRQGQVLVAPGGVQTRVQKPRGGQFPVVRCQGEERVSGHCPSVDVLFESVANAMGASAVGIILTGMGSDGAEGLLSMRRKGCQTYGQDESTSMVYGMPKVAHMKGAVKEQLPLGEIPQALCSYLMSR